MVLERRGEKRERGEGRGEKPCIEITPPRIRKPSSERGPSQTGSQHHPWCDLRSATSRVTSSRRSKDSGKSRRTDRQTYRHTDRQTYRHTDRQASTKWDLLFQTGKTDPVRRAHRQTRRGGLAMRAGGKGKTLRLDGLSAKACRRSLVRRELVSHEAGLKSMPWMVLRTCLAGLGFI